MSLMVRILQKMSLNEILVILPKSAYLNSHLSPMVQRVDVMDSLVLNCFYHEQPVKLIMDTQPTTNLVIHAFAELVGLPMKLTPQTAYQANGVTSLDDMNEIHCTLTQGESVLWFNAFVVCKLDTPVLVWNHFFVTNDISTRPKSKKKSLLADQGFLYYGAQSTNNAAIFCTQAVVLCSFAQPSETASDAEWA